MNTLKVFGKFKRKEKKFSAPYLYDLFALGNDDKELFKRINQGHIEFPSHVSGKAKNLIISILQLNPENRPSLERVEFSVCAPISFTLEDKSEKKRELLRECLPFCL